jgi:hypothetical protein
LDAGVRTIYGYTVEKAVTDWLAEGLPSCTAKTVEVNRDALRPLLAVIGAISLKDLTVQDARTALTRAVRPAEGQDLVRRNVSALVDTPWGRRTSRITCGATSAGVRQPPTSDRDGCPRSCGPRSSA